MKTSLKWALAAAGCLALIACGEASKPASAQTPAASVVEKEVADALDAVVVIAQASASEPGLFARLARPFGPLNLTPPPAGLPPADAAAIEAALGSTAATSVVRDEFGGVRLIHKDSIGDNEAGLLFATEAQARAVDDRQLPNGGRYLGLEPVAPGVYFYMRT